MAAPDTSHFTFTSEAAGGEITVDLGDGVELLLNVSSRSRSTMEAPQKGGPEDQTETGVVVSIFDRDDNIQIFFGTGIADINETFTINARGGTVQIEGTVLVENPNEQGGEIVPVTLDLTIQTSGPFVDFVGHGHEVIPGLFAYDLVQKISSAEATVTGTFSVGEETYDLSTPGITTEFVGISTAHFVENLVFNIQPPGDFFV